MHLSRGGEHMHVAAWMVFGLERQATASRRLRDQVIPLNLSGPVTAPTPEGLCVRDLGRRRPSDTNEMRRRTPQHPTLGLPRCYTPRCREPGRETGAQGASPRRLFSHSGWIASKPCGDCWLVEGPTTRRFRFALLSKTHHALVGTADRVSTHKAPCSSDAAADRATQSPDPDAASEWIARPSRAQTDCWPRGAARRARPCRGGIRGRGCERWTRAPRTCVVRKFVEGACRVSAPPRIAVFSGRVREPVRAPVSRLKLGIGAPRSRYHGGRMPRRPRPLNVRSRDQALARNGSKRRRPRTTPRTLALGAYLAGRQGRRHRGHRDDGEIGALGYPCAIDKQPKSAASWATRVAAMYVPAAGRAEPTRGGFAVCTRRWASSRDPGRRSARSGLTEIAESPPTTIMSQAERMQARRSCSTSS